MNKILIVGDIHENFGFLNDLIKFKSPDYVIQCGDNAYYWSHVNSGKIRPRNTKVYMIPGNHENYELFNLHVGRNGKDPVEVEDNIFYCPIGSTFVIGDKNFLAIGGADSIDKNRRTLGVDWWRDEVLTHSDYYYIMENVKTSIDVVISHTCPTSFNIRSITGDRERDPSRKVLQEVLEKFHPSLWYFGHWHEYTKGVCGATKWTCLGHPLSGDNWFEFM